MWHARSIRQQLTLGRRLQPVGLLVLGLIVWALPAGAQHRYRPWATPLAARTVEGKVLWLRLVPAPRDATYEVAVARPGFVEILDEELRHKTLIREWGAHVAMSPDGAWICAYDPGTKGAPFNARLLDGEHREAARFSVDFQPLRGRDLPRFSVHVLSAPAVAVLLAHRDPKQLTGWDGYVGLFDKSGQNIASFKEVCTYPVHAAAGSDMFVIASQVPMDPSGIAARISAFSAAGKRIWEAVVPDWAPMCVAVSPGGERAAVCLYTGSYTDSTLRRQTRFYDRKGALLGADDIAATEIAFAAERSRLVGIRDSDLIVFDDSVARRDWTQAIEIDGVNAPVEAVAPAERFVAVVTRRKGLDEPGKPAVIRTVHLIRYFRDDKPVWRKDFSTTPEGEYLGKPGVALTPDGSLMAIWERDRVWTYRITQQ